MSEIIKVDVKGLAELKANFDKMTDLFVKKGNAALAQTTINTIAKEARRLVPVKTGTLKKSIKVRKIRNQHIGVALYRLGHTVGSKAKFNGAHASLVEFGTHAHLIPKEITLGRRLRIGKNKFITGQVMHPGIKPTPYMRQSYESMWRPGMNKAIKRVWRMIEREKFKTNVK